MKKKQVWFRQMTNEEFLVFKNWSVEDYARALLSSGQCSDIAHAKVEAINDFTGALSNGLNTDKHYLNIIYDEEGINLGMIWYETLNLSRAFIEDFVIKPEYRTMGYGRAALLHLEEVLKRENIPAVVLHVFEENNAARHLYEACGYSYMQKDEQEAGSMYMKKVLNT